MQQEVFACDVREEHRHIKQCIHIVVKIACSVGPHSVPVEAGSRCAGCPQFIVIFHYGQHLILQGFVIVKQESGLKEYTQVLLPEMIIEDAVFLRTLLLRIIKAQYTHQQVFYTLAFFAAQSFVEQIVGLEEAVSDVGASEVVGKQDGIAHRGVEQ